MGHHSNIFIKITQYEPNSTKQIHKTYQQQKKSFDRSRSNACLVDMVWNRNQEQSIWNEQFRFNFHIYKTYQISVWNAIYGRIECIVCLVLCCIPSDTNQRETRFNYAKWVEWQFMERKSYIFHI